MLESALAITVATVATLKLNHTSATDLNSFNLADDILHFCAIRTNVLHRRCSAFPGIRLRFSKPW